MLVSTQLYCTATESKKKTSEQEKQDRYIIDESSKLTPKLEEICSKKTSASEHNCQRLRWYLHCAQHCPTAKRFKELSRKKEVSFEEIVEMSSYERCRGDELDVTISNISLWRRQIKYHVEQMAIYSNLSLDEANHETQQMFITLTALAEQHAKNEPPSKTIKEKIHSVIRRFVKGIK